jgi:uncharacterized membrane protein
MAKVSNLSARFWSTDTNLSAILIFLFTILFLFYPFYHIPVFKFIIKILFLLILVSGCAKVLKKRWLGTGVALFIAAYILANGGEVLTDGGVVSFWNCIINFMCCGLLAMVLAVQVFKEERVTVNHIQGAVAIYLLLGLMWGFLYQAIALKDPGAFVRASASVTDTVDVLKRDFIYYSFTTLTTVGYGDIAPVHPAARMLATLEAIVGQMFPAILISWLVSMQIMHSRREKG